MAWYDKENKFRKPGKEATPVNIHESAEDYLEKILMLQEQKGSVRSIDIAVAMGYSKPSVSVAMKKLRENDQITVSPEGYLYLTESGMAIAEKIYERHLFLSKWLENLGVDAKVAASDACKIEHVISEESFQALKRAVHELREQQESAKEDAADQA